MHVTHVGQRDPHRPYSLKLDDHAILLDQDTEDVAFDVMSSPHDQLTNATRKSHGTHCIQQP
jgi:hypothetical protein